MKCPNCGNEHGECPDDDYEIVGCKQEKFRGRKITVLVTKLKSDRNKEEGHPLKCPICDANMVHDSLNWKQWLCRACKKWFFCRLDYAIVDMDNYYGFQHWRTRLSQFICKSYATRENNEVNYTEIM